ncbi:conserved hypothetical protein [Vibrio nigripulchritudo MADA3029]|uniref:hypothetical protein n=1 Tax=Vibrio nigripulchritudo TaxID=28173 RepID=UPI0003B1F008|nr:hypothetical protein [Vibrio nigripulchritudo]CCN49700.1 conserved hypothetical protein [Vibrio nigripulchritudo MADA3020]CCN52068.1 conserved hypothetical protein [Vibrio nigripulchritudo MADA3021]CCN59331.1 conserved hypothetical protein [Vibrio nigripulchritudo MADA3029]BCL69708.1 hypothetical protein VNTUMSATTG_16450 [Vibrio nigripulchritudo]BDU31055.1 hypothetical protein TUMSATVNIG1_16640 [Vibrio nigripulchritudo]
MPAQKLTPARLTQIVVMLLILIAAFTWRTLDQDQGNIINCVVKTCQFSLNKQPFEIRVTEHDIYIVGDSDKFRVSVNNNIVSADKNNSNWLISKQQKYDHILITNKESGDYVKVIHKEK